MLTKTPENETTEIEYFENYKKKCCEIDTIYKDMFNSLEPS